jgi:hypothetical protein
MDSWGMLNYLSRLHSTMNDEPCALLMDSFPEHVTDAVSQKADFLDIEIIPVPELVPESFSRSTVLASDRSRRSARPSGMSARLAIHISDGVIRRRRKFSRSRGRSSTAAVAAWRFKVLEQTA